MDTLVEIHNWLAPRLFIAMMAFGFVAMFAGLAWAFATTMFHK